MRNQTRLFALVLRAALSAFLLYGQETEPEKTPLRITCAQAIEGASEIDGAIVAFEGEAIGELLYRGDHAWINLADAEGALGIWVESSAVPESLVTGSWKTSGDTLLAVGRFNRACAEHGGDLDIHANNLSRTGAATIRLHPIVPWRLVAALLSLVTAVALIPVARRRAGSIGSREGKIRQNKLGIGMRAFRAGRHHESARDR